MIMKCAKCREEYESETYPCSCPKCYPQPKTTDVTKMQVSPTNQAHPQPGAAEGLSKVFGVLLLVCLPASLQAIPIFGESPHAINGWSQSHDAMNDKNVVGILQLNQLGAHISRNVEESLLGNPPLLPPEGSQPKSATNGCAKNNSGGIFYEITHNDGAFWGTMTGLALSLPFCWLCLRAYEKFYDLFLRKHFRRSWPNESSSPTAGGGSGGAQPKDTNEK
jgi:hypothetical protein